ncbi:hypothetical protein ACA910_006510 [Epithemia clementina (nom. ined.)]
MMKYLMLSLLAASATAFAPQSSQQQSSALSASFANEIGAQAPLGFFDPLGLVADGDQDKFDRLRYVELKHGRIAQLAVVGYLTTAAGIRLPGDIDLHGTSYTDIGPGFQSLVDMPKAGVFQILIFIGWLEVIVMKDLTGGKAEFAGDFRNGFIDFGWDKQTDAWKKNKRAIELNQGRAAQMGILGLMFHEKIGVSVLPPEIGF